MSGLLDGVSHLLGQSKFRVSFGCCFLEETKSVDHWKRHAFALTADLEVLERSLSLSAPVLIAWHLNGSKGILLHAVLAWSEHTEEVSLGLSQGCDLVSLKKSKGLERLAEHLSE